jgi:hypothetical protein
VQDIEHHALVEHGQLFALDVAPVEQEVDEVAAALGVDRGDAAHLLVGQAMDAAQERGQRVVGTHAAIPHRGDAAFEQVQHLGLVAAGEAQRAGLPLARQELQDLAQGEFAETSGQGHGRSP